MRITSNDNRAAAVVNEFYNPVLYNGIILSNIFEIYYTSVQYK